MSAIRILSCVPQQLTDATKKLEWISGECKKHSPDIFVTPQEFFGGAVMMSHKKEFTFDELYPNLKKIAQQYKTALVTGLVQRDDDGKNREVIWFINERGEYLGRVVKFALPRYDHVCTSGYGDIVPETDFDQRFKTFEMQGAHVSAMFCWEAFSDLLWTGLGLVKPDVVFSMIKFGINAWPQVEKKNNQSCVKGFGYGGWSEDGGWLNRLRMANVWQVRCPIICSTNSWNLKPISMPLVGCISGIPGQANDSLWTPQKDDKLKTIPEKIIVDEINPDAIRAALQHKFLYADIVGHFPPYDLGKFTMMLKIARIEDRIRSGREQAAVDRSLEKKKPLKGFF